MKKISLVVVLFFALSVSVFSDVSVKKPAPSWLSGNKRFSMNNSVGFSYNSNDGSLRSLYNNYFTYKVSPQLSFYGNLGYYQRGIKTNNFGGMLQGFGFEYKPSSNLLLHFQYMGIKPLKKKMEQGSKQ